MGSIRLKVTQVGADITFGRVITMVEEAEAHRAPVQRIADRFSAFFLPVVVTIPSSPSLQVLVTGWLQPRQRTAGPLASLEPLERTCQYSFQPIHGQGGSTTQLRQECQRC